MEIAIRLSHGCAELRSAAVSVGEADRTWPDSAESRCPQECRPVENGQDLVSHHLSFAGNVGVPRMLLTPALAISLFVPAGDIAIAAASRSLGTTSRFFAVENCSAGSCS